MGKILRILVVAVALAASAGATMRATDALPSESLVVTASSLGQKALNDPAAFDFVEALTTEIGQRLAGTEAHKRAVVWAEARLKAAVAASKTFLIQWSGVEPSLFQFYCNAAVLNLDLRLWMTELNDFAFPGGLVIGSRFFEGALVLPNNVFLTPSWSHFTTRGL